MRSPPLISNGHGLDADGAARLLQFGQQRLCLVQIARIKPFGEPAVDRSEKLASLIPLALIAPEPRHAHCGAEFPKFGALSLCYCERLTEGVLGCRFVLRASTAD